MLPIVLHVGTLEKKRRQDVEYAGFRVCEAPAAEAIPIAHREEVSAIVLSAELSFGVSLDLCRALKGDPQTAACPALLLSAAASPDGYPQALAAGANAWLREPVASDTLLEVLHALLSRPRVLAETENAPFEMEEINSQLLREHREREPAEQPPLQPEQSFRSLFENSTVGIYRTTPDGRILLANSALVSMLGFDSLEELASRNLEDAGYAPGYTRAAFRAMVESQGEVRGLEAAWTRRDGIPVFLRESARAVRQPDGTVCHYDGIVEDFTERKRAEDTLRESEERFRSIFNQAALGIVQSTLDGRFTAVNDRYCEITGYSREELLTMSYRDHTYPDDLSAHDEFGRRLRANDFRPFNMEERYIRKDGSTVWVRLVITPILPREGPATSCVAVIEDITERKRAEQELQRDFEFDALVADLLTRFATCSGAVIENVIYHGLRTVAEFCNADHAMVILRSGGGDAAPCIIEWCAPHVESVKGRLQSVRIETFPWTSSRLAANQPVFNCPESGFPSDAAAERAWFETEGALATLHVPVETENNDVIGCIALHRHTLPQEWTATDITRLRIVGNAVAGVLERTRAEELLRESEEKFSLVFQMTPEPVLITSVADQKIVDINSRFEALSGYTRDEIIGRSTADLRVFVNSDDRARIWSRVLNERKVSDFDVTLRNKAGGLCTGVLSSAVVAFRGSQYLISTFRDLTSRKGAEEALRRQAEFDGMMARLLSEFVRAKTADIPAAVDSALAAIAAFFGADHALLFELTPHRHQWRIGREWRGPRVSPLGDSHDRASFWSAARLSSDTDIVLDLANPETEDGYAIERYREEGATFVLNVAIKGAAGVVTARIGLHRHGGRTPWTPEDAARLKVAGNAISGAMERMRAEEALRESERRFRELADSAPTAMWISGPDKRIVFCNKWTADYASRPSEELLGNVWIEFIHPDDRERYVCACYTAAETRTPFSAEVRFRRADGEYRWFLVTGVPRIVEGVYAGHIGTGFDITDLKHAYEQHLATQKLESLGVLATGIAHDFNNLLGVIVARADAAQGELPPESDAIEDVEQVRRTALRASEIVSQLMTFAGRESAPRAEIDLSTLAADMLDLLNVSISRTAVLKTELTPELPPLYANPAEIRQIIMNLILNASEALGTKPGRLTIRTGLGVIGADHTALRLEVQDTGCGMSDEVKARIFDPFFTTRCTGRGLGLSAVQGIVRRLGGQIQVESAPGQGSRFTVLLPCGAREPSDVSAAASPA